MMEILLFPCVTELDGGTRQMAEPQVTSLPLKAFIFSSVNRTVNTYLRGWMGSAPKSLADDLFSKASTLAFKPEEESFNS